MILTKQEAKALAKTREATRAELYMRLLQIKLVGPQHSSTGICENIRLACSFPAYELLKAGINSWPDKLCDIFPVEGTFKAYAQASARNALWDDPKRLALLDYLIDCTEPLEDQS